MSLVEGRPLKGIQLSLKYRVRDGLVALPVAAKQHCPGQMKDDEPGKGVIVSTEGEGQATKVAAEVCGVPDHAFASSKVFLEAFLGQGSDLPVVRLVAYLAG